MILLSRIIKSNWTNPTNEKKKPIKIKQVNLLDFNVESEVQVAPNYHEAEIEELLEQARQQAIKIIQEANLEAENILLQVKQEKEYWEHEEKPRMIEQARNEGFGLGTEEGRNRGYSEMQSSIELAKEVVDLAKLDYQSHIDSSEGTILELGLKVAEKIINKRLEMSEEDFYSIVKKAMKEARDYKDIQLHVHPIHYGFLLSQKDELLSLFPKETNLYIYPDDELTESNCIIESSNGRIDASVDSQLDEVRRKLFEILEGDESSEG
ncbi:flagellar assembly protein FliH [Peribacillus acanthi]|uniref:flagellar assembly protein FliH n=1 Tax=Peribacillus acanthi TaxID=2171554 RepID=UPI000D3E899C|nr:flagellar assembly protein FliH [Peribacillus acanthi]